MNKKSILSVAFATICIAATAQVRWVETEHNFGVFSEDLGAVDAVFELVNESDKAVRILDARATCGCTQPVIPKEAVEPGDTAQLKVTYLATGRPGRFSKHIYVKTSDKPSEQQTLTISGTVIGASATLASRYPVVAGSMRLRNQTVGFGEVVRGKLKTIFIEGYNQSPDTLYPAVEGLPDYIDIDIKPAAVAPGEQMQMVFTLQTLKVPQWGISADTFRFIPNGDEEEAVEMDFFTIVSEDFSRMTPGERINAPIAAVTPERINLGEIGVDDVQTVEFEIKNTGKSPLMIRRVQVVDSAVTDVQLSSDKVKSGKSTKIKLTIDPSKSKTEFINARVTVITNDPSNSLITSRITAEIK